MKSRFGNRTADRLFILIIVWSVASIMLFAMGGTHPQFNPSTSMYNQVIGHIAYAGIMLVVWPSIFFKINVIVGILSLLLNFVFIYLGCVFISKTIFARRLYKK